MISWLGAFFLVAATLVLLRVFGLVSGGRQALAVAREAFGVISDKALSDEVKEAALQRHARRLFGLSGRLAASGAGAVMLPLGLVWGADRAGLLSQDEVLAAALSWPALALASVVGAVVLWWGRGSREQKVDGRLRAPSVAQRGQNAPGGRVPPQSDCLVPARRGAPPTREGEINTAQIHRSRSEVEKGPTPSNDWRYSAPDRWLHRIAFATTAAQVAVADSEDAIFRRQLAGIPVERPVFIAGLPRAGTTLLLELCAGLDEFATHTYRRMPFVLTPLLWEKMSRAFRVDSAPRERAHGDGMRVSADSPEALEEILWLAFWKQHYGKDRILPWTAGEGDGEFLEFFRSHIRKLIALMGDGPGTGPAGHTVRYISKNNLNIARIPWLARALPDARFLIPFRTPLQHAASLLRQHRNFLELHRNDPFAKRYMAAVGHFDFGASLRPIDFDGWVDTSSGASPRELDFWLRYWTAAYQHLCDTAGERVKFVDYDAVCAGPDAGLEEIAAFLELRDRERFRAQASRIRVPRPHDIDVAKLDREALAAAERVHARLLAHAKTTHAVTSTVEM